MKRALLVLLCALLGIGIFALWSVVRDTPDKVLRDGVIRLVTADSFESITADVAWTNPSTRVTTGFEAAGRVRISDIAAPEFLGVVQTGEGVFGNESSANVLVSQNVLALRPIDVDPSLEQRYVSLIGATTGTPFITMRRDAFLERTGYASWLPHGAATSIQRVLSIASPIVAATGPWVKESGRLVSVPFRIDREAFRSFSIALATAWRGGELSVDDLTQIDRRANDLARGTFWLTVDRGSREPVSLRAAWPVLDEQGVERLRIRVRIDMHGRNAAGMIGLPAHGMDVTSQIMLDKGTELRSANRRAEDALVPGSISVTSVRGGMIETPTLRLIDEQQTDIFQTYLEELNHRGDVYYP